LSRGWSSLQRPGSAAQRRATTTWLIRDQIRSGHIVDTCYGEKDIKISTCSENLVGPRGVLGIVNHHQEGPAPVCGLGQHGNRYGIEILIPDQSILVGSLLESPYFLAVPDPMENQCSVGHCLHIRGLPEARQPGLQLAGLFSIIANARILGADSFVYHSGTGTPKRYAQFSSPRAQRNKVCCMYFFFSPNVSHNYGLSKGTRSPCVDIAHASNWTPDGSNLPESEVVAKPLAERPPPSPQHSNKVARSGVSVSC
jgi:hypothetical protein